MRVSTVGAAYCANKGAGSMIQAIIDGFAGRDVAIDVHSTYPIADAAALADYPGVRVVSARPKAQAAVDFPLAVIAGLLRKLRMPYRWVCRTSVLRSFADTDVVADVTGISFSDSRPAVFAPYHFLLDAIPLLMGVSVVKCSQAIGPFESLPVKLTAKAVLPRLSAVVARGPASSQLLEAFGIDHVDAHDLAFAMELRDAHRDRADGLLSAYGLRGAYVIVAPSTLVMQKSDKAGTDYVGMVAEVARGIAERCGVQVLLLAHSSQPSEPSGAERIPDRLNDLVVCRAVRERLAGFGGVVFVDEDLPPAVLRALIARAELLVTSRFHAMVSALAVATPPVVIGWSHKYAEVLSAFGIDENAVDYTSVDSRHIVDVAADQYERRAQTRSAIADIVPSVVASARQNFDLLEENAR